MIRVVPFATTLDVGGTEKQLVALIERLDRERFDPEVACLGKGQLRGAIERCGVPIRELPIRRLYGPRTWKKQAEFARYLREQEIDVVHTHGFYANVFALPPAKLARRPALVGSVREQAAFWGPARARVNRWALGLADAIVVNAETVRDELIALGLDSDKLRVIPNGLDLDRFAAPRGDRGLRAELGWAADTTVVGLCSRITAGKGLDHFLEAAAIVTRSWPDVRFLVVGDGSDRRAGVVVPGAYRGEMRRRAADLGLGDKIVFAGHRTDIPHVLAQLDVAVLPSLTEALSNSLLEAMAAGAPLVATRVGDHGRVVEDGRSGYLVIPGDAGALAQGIERLLADPAKAVAMGRQARKVARERFSLERMVSKHEELYEELVARRKLAHVHALGAPEVELRVEIVKDTAGLLALADDWRAVHERANLSHPFASFPWMWAWWQAFGAGRQLHVVVVRRRGEAVAIAPFMIESVRMYGIKVRRLAYLANEHTPRCDCIVADPEAWPALVAGLLAAEPDVLQVPQLSDSSPTLEHLLGVARERGIRTHLWHSEASPLIAVSGDYQSYLGTRSSGFRSSQRRRVRRLAEVGKVEVETVAPGPELPAALAEGFRIEAAAWKGEHGTAIASRADTLKFYELMAEEMGKRGWLRPYFLSLDGKRIAFNLCLRYREATFMLKHGYDPELAQYSPAAQLCDKIFESAFEDGQRAVELLGDDEDWKRSWTNEVHHHVWLFGFGPRLRARLVEKLKFDVVPVARRWWEDARNPPIIEAKVVLQ